MIMTIDKYLKCVKDTTSNTAKTKVLHIILDPAHGIDTPGKCSPDKSHYEYIWSREIITLLTNLLQELGYTVSSTNDTIYEIGLTKRKNIADAFDSCDKQKLVVSIHNNGCGNGTTWENGTGIEFYTTTKQTKSDIFAECLYHQFGKKYPNIKERCDNSDGDLDKESNFTILTGKSYYACLLEILFQDNKNDVEILKSNDFKIGCVQVIANAIEQFNYIIQL